MRSYNELIKLQTFEERYSYLKLGGEVGNVTFGGNRYLNQMLYSSPEWKSVRDKVIVRDNGCDLAIPDRPVARQPIYIHHLNPISLQDIVERNPIVFSLDNLICVSFETHNSIHYGDASSLIPSSPTIRKPGDTKLW